MSMSSSRLLPTLSAAFHTGRAVRNVCSSFGHQHRFLATASAKPQPTEQRKPQPPGAELPPAPARTSIIGLGKIGSALATNLAASGTHVTGFDPFFDRSSQEKFPWTWADSLVNLATSAAPNTASHDQQTIVLSVLPNDAAVEGVVFEQNLIEALPKGAIHISISTISTALSAKLQKAHTAAGQYFVAAPVFARPDGLARRDAYFPVAGDAEIVERVVRPLLAATVAPGKAREKIRYFGPNAEQANVVKLCGNFLIGSAIQAMTESFNLAESYGVDREEVYDFLTAGKLGTPTEKTGIFDCLIYRGYGQRVSEHDHFAYENAHFALDLGRKDMLLVKQAAEGRKIDIAAKGKLFSEQALPGGAEKAETLQMPFLDTLGRKFDVAKEKGRGKLDWSAIALVQ